MPMLSFASRRILGCLMTAAIVAACSAGCGGDKTNRISGQVTFNGQPVPAGKIYFMPDGSKGNSGATGYADIKDGNYDTSSTGGMGTVSGPMIVAIEGLDPSAPGKATPDDPEVTVKLLFPRWETELDVSGDTTKDFVVPPEAAKGPPKPKGQPAVIP
jgi:hypothetical protein